MITSGHGESPQVFDAVKAIISSGDVVGVGIPIFQPDPVTRGHWELLTPADDHYDLPPASDGFLAGFHAVTIVGYDQSQFSGTGGYKIVNEWGADWGNNGFAWISERFLNTYGLEFYRMTDRIGYEPTAMAHFQVYDPYWWYDNVIITLGLAIQRADLVQEINNQLYVDSMTLDMWVDITEEAAYLPADLGLIVGG